MNHAPTIKLTHEILNKKDKKVVQSSGYKAEIEIKVSDNKGKVKGEYKTPFRSYVSNFPNILSSNLLKVTSGNEPTSINNTIIAGGIESFNVNEAALSAGATSAKGIWIGDLEDLSSIGTASIAGIYDTLNFADFNLKRPIPNEATISTGIVYGTTSISMPSSNVLQIKRRFTNNLATTLYIDEIGLVGVDSGDSFLIARDGVYDTFGNPVEVPASNIVDLTYRFELTNSSGFTNNFLRFLSGEMLGTAPSEPLRDVLNASYSYNFSLLSGSKTLIAAANEDAYGLLVGGKVGVVPISPVVKTSDVAIFSQLTDEVASVDSLHHSGTTPIALTMKDGVSTFGLYRDFENKTNENIYVNSAYLVAKIATSVTPTYANFLLAETPVIGAGVDYVTVAPSEILRLRFEISFPLGTLNPIKVS